MVPRPLVPEPSEVSVSEAVPVLVPTVAVFALPRPTLMLVLFDEPATNRLIEPTLLVAAPELPPKLASRLSEKPSLAAVLLIVRACVPKLPLTWMIPKLAGSGLCVAVANRQTVTLAVFVVAVGVPEAVTLVTVALGVIV